MDRLKRNQGSVMEPPLYKSVINGPLLYIHPHLTHNPNLAHNLTQKLHPSISIPIIYNPTPKISTSFRSLTSHSPYSHPHPHLADINTTITKSLKCLHTLSNKHLNFL